MVKVNSVETTYPNHALNTVAVLRRFGIKPDEAEKLRPSFAQAAEDMRRSDPAVKPATPKTTSNDPQVA